jgi:hypothetical protein
LITLGGVNEVVLIEVKGFTYKSLFVGFEGLTAAGMNIFVFWNMTCSVECLETFKKYIVSIFRVEI